MNTTQRKTLQNIGSNIRYYRKKKKLSQEDLAFECNLHRTYIGAVERGERNITILNLILIMDALEIKFNQLYN